MGFVRTGWCDPLIGEQSLLAAHAAELEGVARRQMVELARLVARHEQERALIVARYGLAQERFWREWAAGREAEGEQAAGRAREQRKEPS
jgi:hypothetical protein